MHYYYNYEADAVVREDDERKRYIRYLDDLEECPVSTECREAWGIPSVGFYNMLFPITQEQYDSFGVTWFEIIP